jgi:hypothetical protein
VNSERGGAAGILAEIHRARPKVAGGARTTASNSFGIRGRRAAVVEQDPVDVDP